MTARRTLLRTGRAGRARRPLRPEAERAAAALRPARRADAALLDLAVAGGVQSRDPGERRLPRLRLHQVARVRVVGRLGHDDEEALLAVDDVDRARLPQVEQTRADGMSAGHDWYE